jgi:hypothetical protein
MEAKVAKEDGILIENQLAAIEKPKRAKTHGKIEIYHPGRGKKQWAGADLNRRHTEFQSVAQNSQDQLSLYPANHR